MERRGDRARPAEGRARCWSSWPRPGMCHSDEHLVTGDLPFELPIIGGHEGAGVVEEVGENVSWLAARRPRRVRVHPVVRALPVVLDRPPEPVRPRRADGRRHADHRRHGPPPRPGQGPRPDVPARHVRPPHRRQRGQLHQDRQRHPARPGLPARLRRRHRLGLGRLRRRGRARATSSPSSASAASAPTPSRAPSSPAPSRSGPSTRWRTSGRRRWSSAPRTPRRRSRRRCRPITEASWGRMANKVIMTMGVGSGELLGQRAGHHGQARPGRRHQHPPGAGDDGQRQPARPDADGEAGRRLAVRLGQPPRRHPQAARAVARGPARPRRPGHQDLHARRRQRRLRRHARRQEHPRRHGL